ncbi:MAG: T9SS type A sorting domain-containing protein [Chitinophagales bacterium]
MKIRMYFSLFCTALFLCIQNVTGQGICNPGGNIIVYSNYDGGNLTININENIPNIRLGLCSYEDLHVTITGTYAGNIVEVLYAGYNNDGTTSVTGVDAGLVSILNFPPVYLYDPDGYPYMICAYECDTAYVPGGCNTVDQAIDYFSTELDGSIRYSYMQYGVWSGTYNMDAGGNCCYGATACAITVEAGQDAVICAGDSVQLNADGGSVFSWFPVSGLSDASMQNPYAYPETTTTYYVTGTDADGCSGVDSVTVYVEPLPVAGIYVSGDTLFATGGGTYQWLQDGTVITDATDDQYIPTENGNYSVIVTSPGGCSSESGIVVVLVNAITQANKYTVSVYPNPARDILHVETGIQDKDIMLKILDNNGRTLRVLTGIGSSTELFVDDLPSGMYFIELDIQGYKERIPFMRMAH